MKILDKVKQVAAGFLERGEILLAPNSVVHTQYDTYVSCMGVTQHEKGYSYRREYTEFFEGRKRWVYEGLDTQCRV